MSEHPDHHRITLSDEKLDQYGFPDECPGCDTEAVYPVGPTKGGGNARRCFACDEQYVEC